MSNVAARIGSSPETGAFELKNGPGVTNRVGPWLPVCEHLVSRSQLLDDVVLKSAGVEEHRDYLSVTAGG